MPSSGVVAEKISQPDAEHKELPQGSGETRAALLPRDSEWMFIYWEITPDARARVAREGNNVTVIAWGSMLHRSLEAVEGYDAEVIDLMTLSPIDEETVFKSVRKTGRVGSPTSRLPTPSSSAWANRTRDSRKASMKYSTS